MKLVPHCHNTHTLHWLQQLFANAMFLLCSSRCPLPCESWSPSDHCWSPPMALHAAKNLSLLLEDLQQLVQSEATRGERAHRGRGPAVPVVPQDGQEQMVSTQASRHGTRGSSQAGETRLRLHHLQRPHGSCGV